MADLKITSLGYSIHVGSKSLSRLSVLLKKQKYSQYFILCDENTIRHCLPLLISECKMLVDAEIFEIESGENSKSLVLCSQLWEALLNYNADKNAVIINLGGGVISDLGGFVASAYKRGIDFINIPTTLLAMADASVGGKTGIDHSGLKNVIGTITQPKGVFIDTVFLNTLQPRHLANGMAEVYKMALISDKKFWTQLNTAKILDEKIIGKCVDLKNKIVKKDPADKSVRKTLNFGHTVGHAIESVLLASEIDILHGEAIIAGMLCESYLAHQKKLLSKKDFDEIVNILSKKFNLIPLPSLLFGEMIKAAMNDKKNDKQTIQCALINKIGSCKINVPVDPMKVLDALEFYNSLIQ
jgi:3-dehydroquinate synthase